MQVRKSGRACRREACPSRGSERRVRRAYVTGASQKLRLLKMLGYGQVRDLWRIIRKKQEMNSHGLLQFLERSLAESQIAYCVAALFFASLKGVSLYRSLRSAYFTLRLALIANIYRFCGVFLLTKQKHIVDR